MAMLQRKQYSSSFGHQYVGGTGGVVVGVGGGKRSASASASGMSGQGERASVGAEGGKVVEGDSLGSWDGSGVGVGVPRTLGVRGGVRKEVYFFACFSVIGVVFSQYLFFFCNRVSLLYSEYQQMMMISLFLYNILMRGSR